MNLLLDYVVALINLNGVIEPTKVVEIYNRQNKTKIETADVREFMKKHEKALAEHFVVVENGYFIHESFFDFDEVIALLEIKATKPYYIPPKNVLLKYKDEDYYEETIQTSRMYRFLEKKLPRDSVNSVEDVFYDVLLSCQTETSSMDIMNEITRSGVVFSTEKEVRELLDIVVDLANNTRLWSNNGYTPAELFEKYEKPHMLPLPEQEFVFENMQEPAVEQHIKIGRNDPCPCGSGKKYKKCCLH